MLASQDIVLELFAINMVGAMLHIDLSRRASPCDASSPVRNEPHADPEADVYDRTIGQPPDVLCQDIQFYS